MATLDELLAGGGTDEPIETLESRNAGFDKMIAEVPSVPVQAETFTPSVVGEIQPRMPKNVIAQDQAPTGAAQRPPNVTPERLAQAGIDPNAMVNPVGFENLPPVPAGTLTGSQFEDLINKPEGASVAPVVPDDKIQEFMQFVPQQASSQPSTNPFVR